MTDRINKVSRYQTQVTGNNEAGAVIYRGTTIVRWNADWIWLDSNGWQTVTTKRKMNQTSNEFDLPFSVYQHDWRWHVTTATGDHAFIDGMAIARRHLSDNTGPGMVR